MIDQMKILKDLANRAGSRNIYTFSAFLTAAEQSDFLTSAAREISVPWTLWGGMEGLERQVLRFGSEEAFGYEVEFPIVCLVITPVNAKFADAWTHRDVLGAIMHLGVEREVLGDILIRDGTAYVFCLEKIADYLKEHLTSIRHTTVSCLVEAQCPEAAEQHFEPVDLILHAPRCDGVIAKLYHLSRGKSAELFSAGRVFLNGRQLLNLSAALKEGDIVSVRGFGKFVYDGLASRTKKGNVMIRVRKYQ